MKKKLLACTLLVLLLLSITARADIGPKPSVNVTFKGLGEVCYATLLCKNEVYGPHRTWSPGEEIYSWWPSEPDKAVWQTFLDYEDPDGYYFLQNYWQVDETGYLSWNYYPPDSFKLLLYFPENGTFLSGPIQERYAFDSYYTVDMAGLPEGLLSLEKSYDYSGETLSLLARIVLTIALELVVALLFGLHRCRKQLKVVAVVNVITQVALNVGLNVINYKAGSLAFMFFYINLEFLVFIIEAVIFNVFLRRRAPEGEKMHHPVAYAFVANLISFAAGYALAKIIPGIF